MTSRGVGDVPHLGRGDVEEPGQFRPVCGRLVQQDQKLAVGKHKPCCVRAQALLHILSGTSHGCGVFPKAFPAFIEELRGVEILKKEVDFVNKDPGVLPGQAVRRNAVLDGLHGNGEGGGFQLLPHLIEVEGDNAVADVHVGLMGEHIEGALDKQFRCQGKFLGLPFRLALNLISPVGQEGLASLAAALDKVVVHGGRAAVDDRLLKRAQLPGSHLLLTNAHQQFGLHGHRVFSRPVPLGNRQGADVVGAVGGDLDNLAFQRPHQIPVLPFRVDDDNVIAGRQGDKRDGLLHAEGLARAGDAQNKAVGV